MDQALLVLCVNSVFPLPALQKVTLPGLCCLQFTQRCWLRKQSNNRNFYSRKQCSAWSEVMGTIHHGLSDKLCWLKASHSPTCLQHFEKVAGGVRTQPKLWRGWVKRPHWSHSTEAHVQAFSAVLSYKAQAGSALSTVSYPGEQSSRGHAAHWETRHGRSKVSLQPSEHQTAAVTVHGTVVSCSGTSLQVLELATVLSQTPALLPMFFSL